MDKLSNIKRYFEMVALTVLCLVIEWLLGWYAIPFFWQHESSAAFEFCGFLVFVMCCIAWLICIIWQPDKEKE